MAFLGNENLRSCSPFRNTTAWQLKNPLCVGFGLSRREQIRRVFEAGAKLAVVGSYLADVIGENARGDRLLKAFDEALRPLVQAQ